MATDISLDFGDLLVRHRKAAGLTQEALAEQSGLSARGISDLERGARRSPYADTVERLAGALALSDDDRRTFLGAARQRVGSPGGTDDDQRSHLPAMPFPRIGREAEVRAIRGHPAPSGVWFLTLTGTGGTGKTRLAIEAAAGLMNEFADGVQFVPLGAVSDPGVDSHRYRAGARRARCRGPLAPMPCSPANYGCASNNFEHLLTAGPSDRRVVRGLSGDHGARHQPGHAGPRRRTRYLR